MTGKRNKGLQKPILFYLFFFVIMTIYFILSFCFPYTVFRKTGFISVENTCVFRIIKVFDIMNSK